MTLLAWVGILALALLLAALIVASLTACVLSSRRSRADEARYQAWRTGGR